MKSNAEFPVLSPPRRRKGHSRPSLLDHITLSDGRLAWPVAKAAGVGKLTYHARIKRGVDPDKAIHPVNRPRLSDGRLAWPVAKAAGVSCATFHHRLKAGWSPDEAIRPVARPSERPPQT